MAATDDRKAAVAADVKDDATTNTKLKYKSAVSMVGSMAAPITTPVVKATVAADTKDDAASAAKLKSMKDHYEKVISEQRAAKVRLEARLRSSQNYGGDDRRGGYGGRSSRDHDGRGQPERGRENRGRNDRG